MSKTFNGKSALQYLTEDAGMHFDEFEKIEFDSGIDPSSPDALDQLAEAIQRISQNGRDWRTGEAKVNIPSVSYDLDQFHHFNKKGEPTSVYDVKIFEDICARENIFILGGTPYFYRAGAYYPDESGAHLKTEIRSRIFPEFIRSNTIKRVYDLFLSAEELEKESNELNCYSREIINFKNGMFNAATGELYPHDPKYLSTNQIPHEVKMNCPHNGVVDKWLEDCIPDKDDREMFLEFAGYCMTRDTRQQKFLILKGVGGTGKSTILKMLEAVVGDKNFSNISLLELQQRFASYGLMGKLLNSCADLELGCLEDTAVIKKCLGEDTLRAERKGKDAFSFKSYAKMIFSTNEFPLIKSEKTNAFFRRVLCIEMNKQPKKVDAGLFDKLVVELPHFIELAVKALHTMYKRDEGGLNPAGEILSSRNSKKLVNQMWQESDTVQAWLGEVDAAIFNKPKARVWEQYDRYCYIEGRTSLNKQNFKKSLIAKGYQVYKTGGNEYFLPPFSGEN